VEVASLRSLNLLLNKLVQDGMELIGRGAADTRKRLERLLHQLGTVFEANKSLVHPVHVYVDVGSILLDATRQELDVVAPQDRQLVDRGAQEWRLVGADQAAELVPVRPRHHQ